MPVPLCTGWEWNYHTEKSVQITHGRKISDGFLMGQNCHRTE